MAIKCFCDKCKVEIDHSENSFDRLFRELYNSFESEDICIFKEKAEEKILCDKCQRELDTLIENFFKA